MQCTSPSNLGPQAAVPRALAVAMGLLWATLSGACGGSDPVPAPVWLITVEAPAGTAPESRWTPDDLEGICAWPLGHAVAADPAVQWSSLWTGFWPASLTGSRLSAVPALPAAAALVNLPIEIFAPPFEGPAESVLIAHGLLEGWAEGDAASTAPGSLSGADWTSGFGASGLGDSHLDDSRLGAAEQSWEGIAKRGSASLLWLHVGAEELADEARRTEFSRGLRQALASWREGGAPGQVWIVEMPVGSEEALATPPGALGWASDLTEAQVRCRAWSLGADADPQLAAGVRWSTVDLAATLARPLGLEKAGEADGGRALPYLAGADRFRLLVAEDREPKGLRRALWAGELKLWRGLQGPNAGPGAVPGDHPRLYRWRADPREREDLGPGNADRVMQMENLYLLWANQRRVTRRAGLRLGWLPAVDPPGAG